MKAGTTIIETTLDGVYTSIIEGDAWYPDIIGESVFRYGTPESCAAVSTAYASLQSGISEVICGFETLDGHSCRAVMRRVDDRVMIRSVDTTPQALAVGGGVI